MRIGCGRGYWCQCGPIGPGLPGPFVYDWSESMVPRIGGERGVGKRERETGMAHPHPHHHPHPHPQSMTPGHGNGNGNAVYKEEANAVAGEAVSTNHHYLIPTSLPLYLSIHTSLSYLPTFPYPDYYLTSLHHYTTTATITRPYLPSPTLPLPFPYPPLPYPPTTS